MGNLYDAWWRAFGKPQGAWKLEFQRRGAPHFHLALAVPVARWKLTVEAGELVERQETVEEVRGRLQAWCSATWYRIVASGDDRHLLAGTQVQVLADHPAAYFAGYASGHKISKEYQHTVPDGFDDVGRFWGFWGLKEQWASTAIDRESFLQLRRVAWGVRGSRPTPRSRARVRRGRIQSEWIVLTEPAVLFAERCRRWLDLPPLR